MSEFGVTIDGKHTSEFGLKMVSMYIPQPKTKTNRISIPGASGSIDLTEVLGHVSYEDRDGIQFGFELIDESYSAWAAAVTAIAMWIHGKKVKVITDNDLGFYYICRLEVDSRKSNHVLSSITLTGTAEPFKYEVQSSAEDWLWDTFDFELGVIRDNLTDIIIDSNNRSAIIYGGGIPESPEFIVEESNNLALIYNDRTFNMMVPGTYRFPAVKVGQEDVILNFTGAGKLTVRYRGKYL